MHCQLRHHNLLNYIVLNNDLLDSKNLLPAVGTKLFLIFFF